MYPFSPFFKCRTCWLTHSWWETLRTTFSAFCKKTERKHIFLSWLSLKYIVLTIWSLLTQKLRKQIFHPTSTSPLRIWSVWWLSVCTHWPRCPPSMTPFIDAVFHGGPSFLCHHHCGVSQGMIVEIIQGVQHCFNCIIWGLVLIFYFFIQISNGRNSCVLWLVASVAEVYIWPKQQPNSRKTYQQLFSFSPIIHWVLVLLIGFHNYICMIGRKSINEVLKTLYLKNKA